MKFLLSLFFLSACLTVFGQKEHIIWYFGDKNGMDFSNGAPIPLFDSEMQTFEAAATVCDEEGNLLFYTNGGGRDPIQPSGVTTGQILNRNHDIMYDMGYTEGGGYSARQGALIIPKPGTEDYYYLFTMEELEFDAGGSVPSQPEGRGLSYFEIDMSLNGGLGDVTIADERVEVPLYEGLGGTLHANGKDYWVMVADLGYPDNVGQINQFGVLPVTEDGVGDLVWTSVGSFYLLNPQTKISPNGKIMVSTRRLFGFDNATGAVTDWGIQLDPGGVPTSYGFSPNSRYLYYVMPNFTDNELEILRYDLEASDIQASEEFIAIREGSFQATQMQMGPDGNLYFAEFSGQPLKSRINRIRCPNTENPTFEADLMEFGWTDFPLYFSIGNYTDHIFASDQEFTLNICPSDTIFLCDGNLELSASIEDGIYSWSTGESTASITIDQPGLYTLDVTNFCGAAIDTVVVLGPAMNTLQITGDTILCDGSTVTLAASGIENLSSFEWSTGETTPSISVSTGGIFTLSGTDVCNNAISVEHEVFSLSAPELFSLDLEGQPCEGELISLIPNTSDGSFSYNWSTGETSTTIQVTESGIYSLDVSNICFSASLETEVTFEICDCDYSLPGAFSPNGDNINDGFGLIFPCELLEFYQLTVFNRWGELVWQTPDPGETWDGYYENERLPEDVYAWYMKYKETDKEEILLRGEITLIR